MKLFSFLVLVSTLLLASWTESSPSQAGAQPAQAVNVVAVESQKLDPVLSLPAQIIPYETVDIYPKVTGFIETIRVDRVSHVRASEVIIRLTAPEPVALARPGGSEPSERPGAAIGSSGKACL
jgi:membrane fusion protein, multidrug efflux system